MRDEIDPQRLAEAAREFSQIAIESLADEHGVHAETVIAGTARMAGTLLFRSFGFSLPDAKPGQPVLSELANERGPRLLNIIGAALSGVGIDPDLSKVTDESRSDHKPLMEFLDTQKRLEPPFNDVRQKLNLTLPQSAEAAALTTAMLIQQTGEVLDSNVAFDIAVYGLIEGTKTLPADL
jgi:hypothetical protein